MSNKNLRDLKFDAHIAVLNTKVEALMEKQKELTHRVRSNEKVVAAIGLLGSIGLAFIGAGYFAPKAEACSPPLDGSSFTCPPHDDVVVCMGMETCPKLPDIGIPTPVSTETSSPDYYHNYQTVTVYDTREPQKWDTGSVIQGMRDWQAAQDRTPVSESINNALANLDWYDYGSDDPTEQEELLQLPGNGDKQGT